MNALELLNVSKKFGSVVALEDVSFDVSRGQIISVLGPSGSGKTTALRVIAGFEEPDRGTISIGGKSAAGTRPYERNVGIVFQDYALFPHMTVRDNVAYGPRRRGFSSAEISTCVARQLELVKLRGYEDRRPSELSGGQQQRVALARALATQPQVVLLDEPLSALDAKLRHEIRLELKDILTSVGATTIVVTHDQEEAMSLGEQIIVMNHGRIMQRGSPQDIYSRPNNRFVADFVGRSNWFEAKLSGAGINGYAEYLVEDGTRILAPPPATPSNSQSLCIRQERMRIAFNTALSEFEQPENCLTARIFDVANLGPDLHVALDLYNGARISVIEKNTRFTGFAKGDQVQVHFSPDDCIVLSVEESGPESPVSGV